MNNLGLYDLLFSPETSELNIHKNDGKLSVSFELKSPVQSNSGSNDPKSEHAIQNEIQVALSKHQCTIFRANVGKIKLPDGRFFSTGLPKGFTDLVGFRWIDGKIFFIEVKDAKGRLRPDQVLFHKMLKSHNIIHGVARNVNDALMTVEGGLVGYGY